MRNQEFTEALQNCGIERNLIKSFTGILLARNLGAQLLSSESFTYLSILQSEKELGVMLYKSSPNFKKLEMTDHLGEYNQSLLTILMRKLVE